MGDRVRVQFPVRDTYLAEVVEDAVLFYALFSAAAIILYYVKQCWSHAVQYYRSTFVDLAITDII